MMVEMSVIVLISLVGLLFVFIDNVVVMSVVSINNLSKFWCLRLNKIV